LNTALQTRADLLVIGAQHRRFADATVMGTTTVRVVRHSPIPVLTIVNPLGPAQ
jgi:nucleotide-binding universal stress UspA family protein